MVLLWGVCVAQTGPAAVQHRVKRQTDVSEVPDDLLLCLLEASAVGSDASDCDSLTTPSNPIIPNPGTGTTEAQPLVTGDGCVCVPWWECQDNLVTAAPDGGLLAVVNVRMNQVCPVPEDVCCASAFSPTPTTQTPEPYIPRCGVRHPRGVGATFEGFTDRQAQFGEFPWMAAVMTSALHGTINANLYICGASLVHPQVVLTAAHYVQNMTADQLAVRLGEWNFKLPSEPAPHQDFLVNKILIHPNYIPKHLHYDVALLFLDHEAELGPTVDTICLPELGQTFDGDRCISSGWGKDLFGKEGKYQQILKSIELPAVNHSACQKAMRGTRLGSGFRLHSSFMCAGGEAGSDVCTGDGGSPLVCPMTSDPERYVQAGIVAWGIGCGQEGLPGVYAAVSEAVEWVQDELLSNFGFDIRLGNSRR